MALLDTIGTLLQKATNSGNFSAGSHTPTDVPSEDVKKDEVDSIKDAEKNKANKGTYPEKANEKGVDDPAGDAPFDQQKKSVDNADLAKGDKVEIEIEGKKDDEDEDEKETEKSSDAVYIDLDELEAGVAKSVIKAIMPVLQKAINDSIEGTINKSSEIETATYGLAKSVEATIERIDAVEKSIIKVVNAVSARKSAQTMTEANLVKSTYDGKQSLTKSEIAGKLLDLTLNGQMDHSVVLKYDMSGNINDIPEEFRSRIGL